MPSLGRMLVQRDVVQAGLSTIRTGLSELHIKAASVSKAAWQWSQGQTGNHALLRRFSGTDDPIKRSIIEQLDGLDERKKRIIKDIHLWVETSFDTATQADLNRRFFPPVHVFLLGGGIDSAADDLLKEVKQLLDEAEDIERRLVHFSDFASVSAVAAMTPVAGSRDLIFVAYSHDDKPWLDRLKKHLRPLVRGGALELWEDTQLKLGARWREEIELVLGRASIAVLLVSVDFLGSDFIAGVELPTVLDAERDRGLTVVPVFVAPCDVPENILRFQGINSPAKTLEDCTKAEADRVLVQLVKQMRERMSL